MTELTKVVQGRFAGHVLGVHTYRGQTSVSVTREGLAEVAKFLRDEPSLRFDVLMDLTCVDYLKFGKSAGSEPTLRTPSPLPYYMKPKPNPEVWERPVSNDEYRFEIVYHLFSSTHHHRLRLKVPLKAADLSVESMTGLWAAANWFEREVWDMFGVTFTSHPDLRRILMYEEFQGHPLRKDYPVSKRQPLVGPFN